uniref:Uncharacterized protein n=1 Tax=Callorhinchus milii TaxID=7868 RepID=A0A4W3HWW8_CALMI
MNILHKFHVGPRGWGVGVLNLARGWYKQAAKTRYYTVGRASGILLGIHRSPYTRRRSLAQERPSDPLPSQTPATARHQPPIRRAFTPDPASLRPSFKESSQARWAEWSPSVL